MGDLEQALSQLKAREKKLERQYMLVERLARLCWVISGVLFAVILVLAFLAVTLYF